MKRYCLYLILVSLLFPGVVHAGTAPDIPINNRIYDYLDRLEVRGFIKTSLTSTKPFSRLEGRRLVDEAMKTWDSLPDAKKDEMQDIRLMLDELDKEFSAQKTHQETAGRKKRHFLPVCLLKSHCLSKIVISDASHVIWMRIDKGF